MLISVDKKAVVEFAILFTIKLSFYFLSINLKGFKLHENVNMVRSFKMFVFVVGLFWSVKYT